MGCAGASATAINFTIFNNVCKLTRTMSSLFDAFNLQETMKFSNKLKIMIMLRGVVERIGVSGVRDCLSVRAGPRLSLTACMACAW